MGFFCRFWVLAASWLLIACNGDGGNGSPPASNADAVRIVAHQVVHQPEVTRIEALGTARARASAVLFPETGGEVEEVLFKAGDFVEQGEPLIRLEAREERLAADLARVAVQEAEQLLARYRRIENTGAVSDSQIDEAQTALDAAKIELQQAEVALEERTVNAPFSGFVGLTDIDPGARISNTTEITRIDDRRVLYVDFAAPEQVFGRLTTGDIVNISPFADPDNTYEAKVIAVDSRINPTRRTFTIRTELGNRDDSLRPGMSFSVGFELAGRSYPVVPEAAIVWGSDGSYVWGVRDDAAQRIPVTIISREEGRVLVKGDIPEGSLVVAEGVQKVRDGARVSYELNDRDSKSVGASSTSTANGPE